MQTLEGEKCNFQGCKLDVLNQEGFKVTYESCNRKKRENC